jgi:hypothetical protein
MLVTLQFSLFIIFQMILYGVLSYKEESERVFFKIVSYTTLVTAINYKYFVYNINTFLF